MNHRINIVRINIVSAATIAVFTLSTAPTVGRPVCEPNEKPCAQAGPTATVHSLSPYAEPLDALGGRTLAQYLADHQAGDWRLDRVG